MKVLQGLQLSQGCNCHNRLRGGIPEGPRGGEFAGAGALREHSTQHNRQCGRFHKCEMFFAYRSDIGLVC